MIPNIVITGQAGAGKTTVAGQLIDRFELGFQRISFAEPLKVMLGTTNDRHRLQEFGTDVVRRYEPDAWVRLFVWQLGFREHIDQYRKLQGHRPARYVTDDCRFPNELQTLTDRGWCHIDVQATREVRVERLRKIGKLQDESQLEHASETALADMDPHYIIHNPWNDPGELFHRLQALMERINRAW